MKVIIKVILNNDLHNKYHWKIGDSDITPKFNLVKNSTKDKTTTVHIYNFMAAWIDPRVKLEYSENLTKMWIWGHLSWELDESCDWNISLQKYRHKITVAIYVMKKLLCKTKDLAAPYIPHIQNPSNKWMDSFNVPLIFATIRLLIRNKSKDLKAEISGKSHIFLVTDQREEQSTVQRMKLRAFMKIKEHNQEVNFRGLSLTRNKQNGNNNNSNNNKTIYWALRCSHSSFHSTLGSYYYHNPHSK